jgi:hypothetical protein
MMVTTFRETNNIAMEFIIFWIGKWSILGPLSIAMLVYWKVKNIIPLNLDLGHSPLPQPPCGTAGLLFSTTLHGRMVVNMPKLADISRRSHLGWLRIMHTCRYENTGLCASWQSQQQWRTLWTNPGLWDILALNGLKQQLQKFLLVETTNPLLSQWCPEIPRISFFDSKKSAFASALAAKHGAGASLIGKTISIHGRCIGGSDLGRSLEIALDHPFLCGWQHF